MFQKLLSSAVVAGAIAGGCVGLTGCEPDDDTPNPDGANTLQQPQSTPTDADNPATNPPGPSTEGTMNHENTRS